MTDKTSGKFYGVWFEELSVEHIRAMDNAYRKGYLDGTKDFIDAIRIVLDRLEYVANGGKEETENRGDMENVEK